MTREPISLRGSVRPADDERDLRLIFSRRPTDDELRMIHDTVSGLMQHPIPVIRGTDGRGGVLSKDQPVHLRILLQVEAYGNTVNEAVMRAQKHMVSGNPVHVTFHDLKMTPDTAPTPCVFCNNTGWVDDQNWQPDYPDIPQVRAPGAGMIRCMTPGCGAL